VHEKARAETVVADARQAIADEAGIDRIRPLIADLQQLVHGLPTSAAAAAPADDAGFEHEHESETADEEVVDAEFTRE
jgi:molecular chaperone DnaK